MGPGRRNDQDADAANRYFQGKENISLAIARRRIKTKGNIEKALALLPIPKPVPQYRAAVRHAGKAGAEDWMQLEGGSDASDQTAAPGSSRPPR